MPTGVECAKLLLLFKISSVCNFFHYQSLLSDYIHDHHGGMKQTMSFMVVMLASVHFVVYAAVFAATGGYTFTQMAAFTGAKASSLISSLLASKEATSDILLFFSVPRP